MTIIKDNCAANVNFDRFMCAEFLRKGSQALAVWALCRSEQKPFSQRIPFISTIKQCPDYRGFFTSAGDTDRVSLYQASPDQMEPMPLTYQTRNRTVTMSRVLRGYIFSTSQMSDAKAERERLYVAHSKRVIPLFMQCVKHERNNCPNLVSRVKQFTQSTNFPYWVAR